MSSNVIFGGAGNRQPNQPPTDITLSSTTVQNDVGAGVIVAAGTVVDADSAAMTSVTCNNSKFSITAQALKVFNLTRSGTGTLNSGTPESAQITATDTSGNAFSKTFSITVTSANTAPTDISLSSADVQDNAAANSVVGALGVTDPGETSWSFAITNGNPKFALSASSGATVNLLRSASGTLTAGVSETVTIQVTDSGSNTFSKSFTITVQDHTATTSIGTLRIDSLAGGTQTNMPFEAMIALPASKVDATRKIKILDGVTNIPIQEDLRSSDADGWVRLVKIAGVLPSVPSGASAKSLTVQSIVGTPTAGTAISVADIVASDFELGLTLTMPDGTAYTFSAVAALQASSAWTVAGLTNHGALRSGDTVTEYVVSGAPVTGGSTYHPTLRVWAHLAFMKAASGAVGGGNPIVACGIDFKIENGYLTVAGLTDQVYDLAVTTGKASPAAVTGFPLNGGAGDVTLTLGAVSGATTATRASGNWALSQTANSSDNGKAIVEVGGTGQAYIQYCTGASTAATVRIPSDKPFASTSRTSGQWKKMGVYHCANTVISSKKMYPSRFWWGTQPQFNPVLTAAYLKSTGLFLNYAADSTSASVAFNYLNADGQHPGGMGSGTIMGCGMTEAATGDAEHIGVIPYLAVVSLLNWDADHANARKALLTQATARERMPCWFRDDRDGGLVSYSSGGVWANASTGGTGNDNRPAEYNQGNGYYSFAFNHTGQQSYAAYVLTGDLAFLDGCIISATSPNMRTSSDYGIANSYSATLNSNGTNRWTTTFPCSTGDEIRIAYSGFAPQIGGVNISRTNSYFLRVVNSNTVDVYDTRAHAIAGGATGQVNFSSGGTTVTFVSGKNKNPVTETAHSAQPRQIAWMVRTYGMAVTVTPDAIPTSIIGPVNTKADARQCFAEQMKYLKTNYVSSANYQTPGPRFFGQQNGDYIHALWMMDYNRLSTLHALESGVQSFASSDLQALVDWLAAEPISRITDSNVSPYFTYPDYYTKNRTYNGTTNPIVYTWGAVYPEMLKRRGNGSQNHWSPPGMTADVASVADQANVTVVLKQSGVEATYFDTGTLGTGNPSVGGWLYVGSGVGQIKSVSSKGTCVVDCTVAAWELQSSGAGVSMAAGNGQSVNVPYPPLSVANSVAGTGRNWGASGADTTYMSLGRSAVEIAKQRGINSANYNSAAAHISGRGVPSNPPSRTNADIWFNGSAISGLIKHNVVSRV